MQETIRSLAERLGLAYWVEIRTERPACVYYFGPFLSRQSAEAEVPGYREDLESEGAQGLQITVGRMRPTELTITDDWGDWKGDQDLLDAARRSRRGS
jgi:hypothetical protein